MRLAWAATLPLALVVLVAAAAAQGADYVRTSVAPAELVLDPPAQVTGEPYSVTVGVQGRIQCTIGLEPPIEVFVESFGSTAVTVTQGGETVTAFGLEVRNFTVVWQPDPSRSGRYVIDATREIGIINDAAPPQDYVATIEWTGQQLDDRPTHCNPGGYGWTIDATPHTITVPSFRCVGDCATDPSGDDENGVPVGAWLPFAAIGIASALGRRQNR